MEREGLLNGNHRGVPVTHSLGYGRPSQALRVLIADRAPTVLGIRMALETHVEFCEEANHAEQAIRAAMREQPDACLIGRALPGDGLAAVRGIARAAPRSAVVVLAEVPEAEDLLECVRAGATGYVPAGLDAEALTRVIRAIAKGEAVIPRSMVLELVMELRAGGAGADALTARESQVLGMLRRGHSTAMIAARLNIAPVTVRRHISQVVHKLGVSDRSELAAHDGTSVAARASGANNGGLAVS
jgi:two-component system, NarL family, response regulator DevR